MTAPTRRRLARLRGALAEEEPGARGLEHMARNPACLRALTLAGIAPATAARVIYGAPAREGQSPFALALGRRYEAALYADGAATLLRLYRDAGRLPLAQENAFTQRLVFVARDADCAACPRRSACRGRTASGLRGRRVSAVRHQRINGVVLHPDRRWPKGLSSGTMSRDASCVVRGWRIGVSKR